SPPCAENARYCRDRVVDWSLVISVGTAASGRLLPFGPPCLPTAAASGYSVNGVRGCERTHFRRLCAALFTVRGSLSSGSRQFWARSRLQAPGSRLVDS